jgi:hypothetical protein
MKSLFVLQERLLPVRIFFADVDSCVEGTQKKRVWKVENEPNSGCR